MIGCWSGERREPAGPAARLIDMTACPGIPRPHATSRARATAIALVGLAATVFASTLLGACATTSNSTAADGTAPPIVTSTPPNSTSPPPAQQPTTQPPKGGSGSSTCPATLVVSFADNSRTLCVSKGGTVTVTAPANQASGWTPFEVSGTSLAPVSHTPAQTGGDTVLAAYSAVASGSSQIAASHRNCPTPAGGVGCNSILLWQVTIIVK